MVDFAVSEIGERYDMKNVFDLARYLFPMPPVPARFRRRMIALGSGDPTRAICSTLIAQAFGLVRYPILPLRGAKHRRRASGPKAKRSCASATTACTCRATSTSRPTSPSSSRPSRTVSTTRASRGPRLMTNSALRNWRSECKGKTNRDDSRPNEWHEEKVLPNQDVLEGRQDL